MRSFSGAFATRFVCLLAFLTVAACAASIFVRDRALTMVGKTEAEVIGAFGQNHTTAPPEDEGSVDGKLLIYRFQSMQEAMMYGNPYQFIVRSRCTVIFTMDAGRVKYVTFRDGSCQ